MSGAWQGETRESSRVEGGGVDGRGGLGARSRGGGDWVCRSGELCGREWHME